MKKSFLYLLLSVFCLSSLISCGGEETETSSPNANDTTSDGIPDANSGNGDYIPPVDPDQEFTDDQKLHLTNSVVYEYYSDPDYTNKIDSNVFSNFTFRKSLYVKIIINSTNNGDSDFIFDYKIDISKTIGYEIESTSGGDSQVTIKRREDAESGLFNLELSNIKFVLGPRSTKTKEFHILIKNDAEKSSTPLRMTSLFLISRKLEAKYYTLNHFASTIKFAENDSVIKVDAPDMIIRNNGISVKLNATSDPKITSVLYIYDDQQKAVTAKTLDGFFEIPNINNHKQVKILVTSKNPTEEDYEKVFNLDKLGAPTLTQNGSKISWNEVANITGYQLYYSHNNGQYKKLDTTFMSTEHEYDLTSITVEAGAYSFALTSIKNQDINSDFSGTIYFESDKSNAINLRKLGAPVIKKEGKNIVWDAINFADEYEIYIDNVLYKTTKEKTFVLDGSMYNKKIAIKAVSSQDTIIDSNMSNHIMNDIL